MEKQFRSSDTSPLYREEMDELAKARYIHAFGMDAFFALPAARPLPRRSEMSDQEVGRFIRENGLEKFTRLPE